MTAGSAAVIARAWPDSMMPDGNSVSALTQRMVATRGKVQPVQHGVRWRRTPVQLDSQRLNSPLTYRTLTFMGDAYLGHNLLDQLAFQKADSRSHGTPPSWLWIGTLAVIAQAG